MKRLACVVLFALSSFSFALSQPTPSIEGSWEMIPAKSTDIDLYGTLAVRIARKGNTVTVVNRWGGGRSFLDSLTVPTDGKSVKIPVTDRVFPTNAFMGLMMPVGDTRTFTAAWDGKKYRLTLNESYRVRGSQGLQHATATHTYELSPNREELTYTVKRSTRTDGPPMRYVFKRTGDRAAYVIRLEDDWEIAGKLPTQALLISLQGIVNKSGPLVYLLYPENWPFTYVQSVYDFYREKRNYTFRELRTAEEALMTLKSHVRGYVVWDTKVRTSLIVAFTVAGLERAVVVSEDLIPLAAKAGLKPVEDFRGRFTGQNDAQIYAWAYDRYGKRTNRKSIVWLGGEHGSIMKPAVADWGIRNEVFFNDLSCRTTDTAEYALTNRILGELDPMSMVLGWHSYLKDLEREFVRTTSRYGHRVEGLHTLPNLSFSCQVPPSPGFVFRNNHHVVAGKDYTPGKKVYIACIQTDGIGLGAWLKPGRGEIPYAWEVLMNYTWMAPAMAEYFYTMATPNDYFVGCLSGPGYLYPKAVPRDFLMALIELSYEQMKTLDLKVFETMDYSEGATVEGNTDLPKDIVDLYYMGMPGALGFVNGYAPSYTFTSRRGKPFVSYDYYLSGERPEADAAADLEELATINAKRPYFLLMHVRESSDVARVKSILGRLGPEFEVVPLDVFLKMAGMQPNFEQRFKQN